MANYGGISADSDFSVNYLLSAAPALGFVFPITSSIRIFADAILELGHFGDSLNGKITEWATPAFSTGLILDFGVLLTTKYRGTWYNNIYTHSIAIGIGL